MAQWKQYSGMWTRQQQMQAVSAQTWPNILLGNVLFVWGSNNRGQLGNGTKIDISSPVQVNSQYDWSNLYAGSNILLATKSNNTAWSCGANLSGELGVGDTVYRSSPVQIGALTNWSYASSTSNASFFVKNDGSLWAFGSSTGGQLGIGVSTGQNRSSPVQVGGLTNWSKISGGSNFVSAVKTDGTLWFWGFSQNGQSGLNSQFVYRSSPVQVGSLSNWFMSACGSASIAAVKTNGTLWSWGINSYGELGQGSVIDVSSPTQVGALTNWAKIYGGLQNFVAIKTDGTLWSWGRNDDGRLGQNNVVTRSSPVQVGSLTNWSVAAVGVNHAIVVNSDNFLFAFGSNSSGQLGQNNTILRSSPVQVGSISWNSVCTSGSYSSSVFATQSVYTT